MRMAGCAALTEPTVHNNEALNGRHDRDNRRGEEEDAENVKKQKQKGRKQTSSVSNWHGNKEEEDAAPERKPR